MKLSIYILVVLLISFINSYAVNNGNSATGNLNVTVEYPDLMVYFNSGVPAGAQPNGVQGGVINIGPFITPNGSQATTQIGNDMYQAHEDAWSNWFIPFIVEGAKGVPFTYVISQPIQVLGDPGVILADGNLKGSQTQMGIYQAIPSPPLYQNVAVLSVAAGKFYIRMHFSAVYIKLGCTRGSRTFETTLTCNYQ